MTGFPPHVILFRFSSSGSISFSVDLLKKMSTSVSRSFFSFVPPRRYVAALSTAFCIGVGFCSGECSSTFSWLLLLVLSSASCASSSCSSSSCSCGSFSALSVGAVRAFRRRRRRYFGRRFIIFFQRYYARPLRHHHR